MPSLPYNYTPVYSVRIHCLYPLPGPNSRNSYKRNGRVIRGKRNAKKINTNANTSGRYTNANSSTKRNGLALATPTPTATAGVAKTTTTPTATAGAATPTSVPRIAMATPTPTATAGVAKCKGNKLIIFGRKNHPRPRGFFVFFCFQPRNGRPAPRACYISHIIVSSQVCYGAARGCHPFQQFH